MIVDKYTKHSVMKVKIIKDHVLKGYEPIRKKKHRIRNKTSRRQNTSGKITVITL